MSQPMTTRPTQRARIALITGGGGFIGQALLRRLLSLGWSVRNLDFVAGKLTHPKLSHWPGSFANHDLLREAMVGVDCIFHLASAHFPREANANPLADCESSILGNIAVTEMAIAQRVRRIVFSSSGGTVYGPLSQVPVPEDHPTRPITAYGISKLTTEHYLRFFNGRGVETLSLRIANPYGSGQNIQKAQGALTTFCHNAARGLPITIWGDGSVERDFIHVEDVAKALVLAADCAARGTEINIGSGRGATLNRLIELIAEVTGYVPEVTYQGARAFDVPRNVLCIQRAHELLGWEPEISLRDGIAEMMQTFARLDD